MATKRIESNGKTTFFYDYRWNDYLLHKDSDGWTLDIPMPFSRIVELCNIPEDEAIMLKLTYGE